MKRSLIPIVAIAALTLAAPALAGSKGAATVKVSNSSLGKILVDGGGRTLYMFTRDRHNKDKCFAVRSCAATWPPLTTSAKPHARAGAKSSLLGTISLPNGSKQVTYAGHPLYVYSGDSQSHETDYVRAQQFGGTWYAVSSTGGSVK